MKEELQDVSIDKLTISRYNVRKAGIYQDIDELAKNIAKIGIKIPLAVTKHDKDKFEIIAGQRRYLAAKKAGLKTIPCIIKKYENTIDCLIESFSENIFRSDMTLMDKANATKQLMKEYDNDKRRVAETLGIATTTVDKYLDVYSLPNELKKPIRTKKMNFETAKTIHKLTRNDKERMNTLIDSYINKNSQEKSAYYIAIKTAKNVANVDDEYNKIRSTHKTELRLPTSHNDFITSIAKDKNMTPEMVLLNLLAIGITEYKRGRVRF